MEGCFYVFNIEKQYLANSFLQDGMYAYQRTMNAINVRKYLSQFMPELDSQTLEINSAETLVEFVKANPDFVIEPKGYDNQYFDKIVYDKAIAGEPTGWKYGQLGIWASNYTAWTNFLKTDYDYVMLLEDDVRLKEGFIEVVNKCLNDLPDDWEIFHACAPMSKAWLNGLPAKEDCEIGKEFVSLPYLHDSNGCYIINRKGVEKVLAQVKQGIFLPLDWHWFKQPLFNIYQVKYGIDQKCNLISVPSTHWDTQPFNDLTDLLGSIS